MNEEIEVKFLDINQEKIENRLKKLGAVKVFDRMFHRTVFDYPGLTMDKDHAWLRLRDEGDKVTLTYKQRQDVKGNDGDDGGMKELEVVVDDFGKTAEILFAIGMIEKGSQENRRIRYSLNGVTVDIDFWPLLKPYIEIEGENLEEVKQTAELMELNWEERKTFTSFQMYKNIGITIHDYKELTFEKQVKR